MATPFQPKYIMLNPRLPYKLNDGESCQAYLSRRDLEILMKEEGWDYPIKIRALFNTNDGKFYSDTLELNEIK